MRAALIADVHGNLPALRAVVAEARAEGVERWLCPGDLVGYGPSPDEAIAAIAELGAECVAGNHDLIAIGELGTDRCSELALTTLEWTREVLSEESRAYLRGLPRGLAAGPVLLAHGGIGDPQLYVRDEAAARAQLERLAAEEPAAELLVLGHTHRTLACGERRGLLLDGGEGEVAIEPGERLLVNPGAVGQAREGRAVARWALLDLEAGTVSFRAVAYDTRAVRRALRRAGLPRDAHRPRKRLRYVLLPRGARRALGRVRRRLAR